MAKVHTLLNEARATFTTKELKKTGVNAISGYSYFELSDFLPTILQINKELGLSGICSFTDTFATLTLTAAEDDSQIVITTPFGAANLAGCHDIQNIGAVLSYQRRYLWMIAYEICERDPLDSGAEALRTNPSVAKAKSQPAPATAKTAPAKAAVTPNTPVTPAVEAPEENKAVTAFLNSIKNITAEQLPERATSAKQNAKETFTGVELDLILTAITDHENILGWKARIASINAGETERLNTARDLAKSSFKGEVLNTILDEISKREIELTAS